MGSKEDQRRWDQLFASLQAQQAAANKPSPYEDALLKDWNTSRDWLNKRNYRNLPTGVNIPMLGLADSQKMRQMLRGSNTNGQGELNPNLLASQRELDDNQFAQDWGGAYENAVGGIMDRNDALAGAGQSSYSNRMNNSVNGAASLLNAWGSRPKSSGGFWSSFGKSLLGSAPSIISAI